MVVRQNEQLFIYNSCVSLVVGFVVGLLFHVLCFLFLILQESLTWWHILIGVLGMLISLWGLVLNVMGWHKKVKQLPIALCDHEYLYNLHLRQWKVPLRSIDSVLLYKHKGGKSIDVVLHSGECKTLITPASFVSDINGVYHALQEQLSLYGSSQG